MSAGEEQRWKILNEMESETVCAGSGARFNRTTGIYSLRSFCWDISVSSSEESISSPEPGSDILLQRLGYFSKLSILWYLTCAKDIPLTGQLVNTAHLKGGQLFFRGSHVLPLDSFSQKYSNDIDGLLANGIKLGGTALDYGDASLMLSPLPRVPVTLILWRGDDEFPPEAKILFDSTCEMHLPIDIIWSVAMMSLLIMM